MQVLLELVALVFRQHVKFAADNVEYVIVNGAECEPLLRVDQQLMEVYTGKLVDTLNAIVSTLGAERVYLP